MEDLVVSIEENLEKLNASIRGRYKIAVERAKAEYTYRTALGKAMANAKAEGMAATALYEYCKGIEEIAELREKRDVLVVQEDYLEQLIYYYKTEIRIAEKQMEAERRGM